MQSSTKSSKSWTKYVVHTWGGVKECINAYGMASFLAAEGACTPICCHLVCDVAVYLGFSPRNGDQKPLVSPRYEMQSHYGESIHYSCLRHPFAGIDSNSLLSSEPV